MEVRLTEEKKAQLRKGIVEIRAATNRYLWAKHLAAVIGKVAACELGLGPIVPIMLRRAYKLLQEHVQRKGWESTVKITNEVAKDMGELSEKIEEFNGYLIRTEATQLSIVALIGPPSQFLKTKVIAQHVKHDSIEIYCGDASAVSVCAYSCSEHCDFHFIGELTPDKRRKSSGLQELLTVKYALQQRLTEKGAWAKQTTMYWLTDSENLVVFLNNGLRKANIQLQMLTVISLCRDLKLTIIPIHLRREELRIQMADNGSKVPDTDDWSVDEKSFDNLSEQFGPFTVDLFAEENNHRVKKFYSSFRCPSSSGVNAFCHSWDRENAWICPPVNKILQVVRKIKLTNGTGVLIVPKWSSARFWPFLVGPTGQVREPFRTMVEFRPIIIQNQQARSALSGETIFAMLALVN